MEEGKKHKVMIGIEVILLGMILAIVGTNAASSNPPSNGVSYSKNNQTTVEGALNDLYNKANYGNASARDILSGKTALVGGSKVTGTMPNRGTVSKTISSGETYVIPRGYHSGSGKITCAKVTPSIAILKLGEYVSYTPNLTSYTITKEDTELKSDQIIKPNELNLWRVIRKNDDGTVDLVSEYASKNQVSFDANTLYFSGIGILNKIAKAYESSTYTTGSRHMGYDGFVVESCGDPCSADNGYEIDVGLVEKAIGTLNSKGFNSGIDYYLASRGGSFKNMHYTTYEARMIANGVVYNMGDLNSYGCGSSPCVGVVRARIRPVVVLKSTLKITGGNGTEESPWTLGI